jgi:RNA polymerase sigma-70 factor (ECF subfamily)
MSTGDGAPPHDRSDWSVLMARAQAGDSNSYRRLLTEISPYLRSLVAARHRDRRDVEDTVQDILLTVHAVRQTYDPARPFGPWLVAIAQRRIVDHLRKRGRHAGRETVLDEDHETFAEPAANIEVDILDRRELHAAIESLPAGQRQAIKLLKLEEMSLKEASEATGTSATALKVATHRALTSLRKMLTSRSPDS